MDDESEDPFLPISTDTITVNEDTLVVVIGTTGVKVINVTDPASPKQISEVKDGEEGFEGLDAPRSIETVVAAKKPYVLVTSREHAVQIMDISNPASPKPVSVVRDDMDGFEGLRFPANIEIVQMLGTIYAIIPGYGDGAIQIIDITDPSSPQPVTVLYRGVDGFEGLVTPGDVEVILIDGRLYLLVTSDSGDAIQIMDITYPKYPVSVSVMRDGEGGFEGLDLPRDIEAYETTGVFYTLVASEGDDTVTIINITDPYNPWPVSMLGDDIGNFGYLSVTHVAGGVYVLVTDYVDSAIRIWDITDPAYPVLSGTIHGDDPANLAHPSDVSITEVNGQIYAVVSSNEEGGAVQILKLEQQQVQQRLPR